MENEFSTLNDLALGRGLKHSDLIAIIHDAILKEYLSRYPNGQKDVAIIVDEKTGNVRLLSGKTDVTPPEFVPVAAQIARQILLQKLKETEGKVYSSSQPSRSGSAIKWLSYLFFWGYNGLYILFAVIFLFNFLLNGNFRSDLIENLKEMGYFRGAVLVLLSLVPLLSIITAFKAKLIKEPLQLGKLLFLLEVPLIFILLVALNAFGSATPAMWFFLVMVIFTLVVFFLDLIKLTASSVWQKRILLGLQQTALTTAGYLTFLYSFFLPLIIGGFLLQLVPGIFDNFAYGLTHIDIGNIIGITLFLIFGLLGLLFFGLLLIAPFLVTYLLFRFFRKTQVGLIEQVGMQRTAIANGVLAVIYLVVLLIVSYQPDISPYIDKLEKLRTVQSFEEKETIARELIPNESRIKRAFEDIYNARNRYIMAKSDDFLKEAYKDVFKFNDGMGEAIQGTFMTLAYPFVYQGTLDRQGDAFKNYEYLFGHPVTESTYKPFQENLVKLVSRTTNATTDYQNMLATITIEEEYENTTWGNQEVVYEFSLPTNATITDLKLGPNLEFDGIVAPRGAASQVYQQELARRRDPALLEQTGPRQYRLRVFPVPGKSDMTLGGKNQKVRFSYVTEVTPDGYPLPNYSTKRNVKIDGTTISAFQINNQNINSNIDATFINNASTNTTSNLCDLSSSITLKTQTSSASAQLIPYKNINQIRNDYTCDRNNGLNLTRALSGTRLAVLYDVSYDNKDNTFLDSLKKTLSSERTLLQNNTVDYYLFNDTLSQRKQLTANWVENPDVVYFGKSDWISALNQLNSQYDVIMVVTTENDIPKEKNEVSIKHQAPIYIVHAKDIAPAYPTRTTYAVLQSGGAVVSTLENALTHYILLQRLQSEGNLSYVSFAPYWAVVFTGLNQPVLNTDEALSSSSIRTQKDDPLTYVVNKAYVMNLISQNKRNLETQTNLLDSFNAFARNAHIVTPFSSMIALVNETQRSELDRLSQGQDRYSYEPPSDRPIFINPPISLGGISRGFGGGVNNLSLPSLDSGSSGAPAMGISPSVGYSSLGFNLIMLFAMLNGLLIGLGGLIFLVIKVKRFFMKK